MSHPSRPATPPAAHQARRRPRCTTRRLALAVALASLPLACWHPEGPRPGLWVALPPTMGGSLACGACRDDAAGAWLGPGGHRGGPAYLAGMWGRGSGRVVLGATWRDGRAYVRAGGWRWAW